MAATAYGAPGRMNGFERNVFCKLPSQVSRNTQEYNVGVFPYAYLSHRQIAPYRALAHQYALADNMYPTEWGRRFTATPGVNRLEVHSLMRIIISTMCPMRCRGVVMPRPQPKSGLTNIAGGYNGGTTFPCFTQYPTMAQLLDAAHLSWRYYVASERGSDPAGQLWNALTQSRRYADGRTGLTISFRRRARF